MSGEVFVRLAWPELFSRKHNLELLAFINPTDGSSLSQLTSEILATSRLTLSASGNLLLGGPATEKGSLPLGGGVNLKALYYF